MDKNLPSMRIDAKAFAKAQSHLSAQTPLALLERFQQDCVGEVPGEVTWAIQGSMRPSLSGGQSAWLHLMASATVPVTCQRCLGVVDLLLNVNQDFRFVADEATALAEDDASTEDLLVFSHDLDVLELVEDELLMALPIVPMHEVCESKHAQTLTPGAGGGEDDKPHPFAVLAALRARKE
jgi:uncharacterized protein